MMERFWIMLLSAVLTACVPDTKWDTVSETCDKLPEVNFDLKTVLAELEEGVNRIDENWVVKAFVISSDHSGNFFNVIYVQDQPNSPTVGLKILLEMRDAHSIYPPGMEMLINLQGLYLKKKLGEYCLGNARSSFGNLVLSTIPATQIPETLFGTCNSIVEIIPVQLGLDTLDDNYLHQLVQINDVEITADEKYLLFSEPENSTTRVFDDCHGNSIGILTSGFADFANEIIPENNGNITGILTFHDKERKLVIRDITDLEMVNPRCTANFILETSDSVLISEIADPDNNTKARFIEFYNSSSTDISLRDWKLVRYTNGNQEPGNVITFNKVIIKAKSTLTLSAYPEDFLKTYGKEADIIVSRNSAADSNGDDNFVLVDHEGNHIDVFGIPGEDGTGTSHEFEDGKALRKPEIATASAVFNPSEWIIFNDSGGNNTIKEPQQAPEDFSPGSHGDI